MSRLDDPWPLPAGRTSWLLAIAAFAAILGVFALADATGSRFGQGLPEPIVAICRWITQLGVSDYILIPSLALFLISGGISLAARGEDLRAAWRRMAGIWGFVFVGVGLPGLFTAIVKRIIGRSRPEHLDALGPFDFRTLSWLDWTYQSFPSGHSTTAFAFCFVVSFLVPRAYPAMLFLAVLIALSRIVVGAHYPTDVLGGMAVGVLGAYLVRNFFAARGWVFGRRPDGRIAALPFAFADLWPRR